MTSFSQMLVNQIHKLIRVTADVKSMMPRYVQSLADRHVQHRQQRLPIAIYIKAGAFNSPNCFHVMTSITSSSVPSPPGNTIKLWILYMAALRSCMDRQLTLLDIGIAYLQRFRKWGIIPVTWPPAVIAPLANAPIRPVYHHKSY